MGSGSLNLMVRSVGCDDVDFDPCLEKQQVINMTDFLPNQQSTTLGRRTFLTSVGIGGAGATLVGTSPQEGLGCSTQRAPFKLDVTIYDRPGWTSTTYGLPLMRRPDGSLVIGFQAQREDAMTDDFYSAHAEWVFVESADSGRSWQEIPLEGLPLDPRWPDRSAHCTNGWPVALPDGSLINVVEEVFTGQQHRERLQKLGLGHLWFEDSTFGWNLWPAGHAEQLRADGIYVFDAPGPHIPEGVVATHNRPLVSTVSRDGGRTWRERRIDGLPRYARCGGWFRGGVALEDGTVVGSITGVVKKDRGDGESLAHGAFALRSHDHGETWQLSTIADNPNGHRAFSECNMLVLSDQRVLALVRAEDGGYLYRSVSDDGGRTWSEPKATAISGSPANMIRLQSDRILCVYRHVGYPAGFRGVLSEDEGMTWGVDRPIIIRDDTLPGLIGYPSSVLLDDGSIFTAYNVLRAGELKPQDNWRYKKDLLIHPPLHSYIAGSIYTEDYLQPLGRD